VHHDVEDDVALSLPSEHQSHCHSVTTIDTLRYIYPRIWTRIDNYSSSLLSHQQRTQHSPKVRFRVPCGSLEYTTAPAQHGSPEGKGSINTSTHSMPSPTSFSRTSIQLSSRLPIEDAWHISKLVGTLLPLVDIPSLYLSSVFCTPKVIRRSNTLSLSLGTRGHLPGRQMVGLC